MSNHQGDNFYNEKYNDSAWLAQREKDAKGLLRKIKGLNCFQKESTVLDVGCGSGELGREIGRQFGSRVAGIDRNEIAISRARENGLEATKGDLDGPWPYLDSSFDVIIGAEIIEHVVNPDNLLREAHRLLKPSGYLVLTTPNLGAWFNRIIFLFGYQPFFAEVSTVDKTIGLSFTRRLTPNRQPVGHIRCFTLKALREIVLFYGFKIILVRGSAVYYLPRYMKIFDRLFKFFPSLSADILLVAKK
jgi:SAM-dependent methyltransferase